MDELVTTTPDTSSVAPDPIPANLHTATGEDRLMAVLYKRMGELEREVYELKTKKIIDETHIPAKVLEQNGMLPPVVRRLKRGRGARPLLRSEIEEAIQHSKFPTDQARYLGVGIECFRKHAKKLGLYNPHSTKKGVKRPWGPEKGDYPLSRILTGEFNGVKAVTDSKVRAKMIKAGWPEECAVCGYKSRRIGSNKVPLLLDHIDGDRNNFKKENLRLLCWNHTIECGRGYLCRAMRYFDPDWVANEE